MGWYEDWWLWGGIFTFSLSYYFYSPICDFSTMNVQSFWKKEIRKKLSPRSFKKQLNSITDSTPMCNSVIFPFSKVTQSFRARIHPHLLTVLVVVHSPPPFSLPVSELPNSPAPTPGKGKVKKTEGNHSIILQIWASLFALSYSLSLMGLRLTMKTVNLCDLEIGCTHFHSGNQGY